MNANCLNTFLSIGILAGLFTSGCAARQEAIGEKMNTDNDVRVFLNGFEARAAPLNREVNLASYEASISGRPEDYKRGAELSLQLEKLYADKDAFTKLSGWRDAGSVADPVLKRQVDVLYLSFLNSQIEPALLEQMVVQSKAIEERFNTHRAQLDGRAVTDNEIASILKTGTDDAQLKAAWMASKEIGAKVQSDVVALVKLRNRIAQTLNFDNYHQMSLKRAEQDPQEIEKLFDELDDLTRDAYGTLKAEIDTHLAARLGRAPDELRPWHYQNPFFQEAPRIYDVDLDSYFVDRDLVETAKSYYAGIGLPVDDILAASDLFEKPGKYQHAFCEDIDRNGDIRILTSLKPNAYWMNTLLHELGHGVYSKYHSRQLPWLLRNAAHAFTTEAVANMFGRFASNPSWLEDVVGISAAEKERILEATRKSQRLSQLVMSRWSQVMFRFEKQMYENPDQDLNTLWWDLVEKYQGLTRPDGRDAPDWAAKIHIALYPAYYHNYLMGELLASQLFYHVSHRILENEQIFDQSFHRQKAVGTFFVEKVFEPGRSSTWQAMIRDATGEELTSKYYAQQFVGR